MCLLLRAANWFSRQGLRALVAAMRQRAGSREKSDPPYSTHSSTARWRRATRLQPGDFAPPGATILELTSGAIEHMNLFRQRARSTRHRIIAIVAADCAVPAGEANVNTDDRVDVQAVRSAVAGTLYACIMRHAYAAECCDATW